MNNVKLIVLDVDGVMTDGKLFIGSDGSEYKAFNTQDGMGISLARYMGIKTAIITGRKSLAVTQRANELKIDFVFQGIDSKLKVLEELIAELGIDLKEICYIGDDINDLPILSLVGFSCAPADAVPFVKERVQYIAEANGGQGAVREIIDHILSKQGNYEHIIGDYLDGKIRIIQ